MDRVLVLSRQKAIFPPYRYCHGCWKRSSGPFAKIHVNSTEDWGILRLTPTSFNSHTYLRNTPRCGFLTEVRPMEDRRIESRLDVCWYLRAGHRTAGTNSART